MVRPLVLDTSAVVPWFFTGEDWREESLELREYLRRDPGIFAIPALFYSEFVHVLARKSGKNRAFVREALSLMVRLGIRTLNLSDRALLKMGDWTCRGLSGYDATFVALAQDLGGRWVTADEKAAVTAGKFAAHLSRLRF